MPIFLHAPSIAPLSDRLALAQPVGVPHAVAVALKVSSQGLHHGDLSAIDARADPLVQLRDELWTCLLNQFLQPLLCPGPCRQTLAEHRLGAIMQMLADVIDIDAPGGGADPQMRLLPYPRSTVAQNA